MSTSTAVTLPNRLRAARNRATSTAKPWPRSRARTQRQVEVRRHLVEVVARVLDGVVGVERHQRVPAVTLRKPRAAGSLWPVVADIGLRIGLEPAIEHVRECCRLGAAGGQVLFQHDDKDEVSFVGKVGDVLGDDGASFGTCVPGDRCVVGRTPPNLGDMMRVSAVLVAKNAGGRGREHLIDDQTDHRVYANSAWRSWVASRLRSRAASLRSMSRSISLRCSAA
jgi:hypothetical protein